MHLTIQRLTIVFIVLFVIAGAVIVALDWSQIRSVIAQANWPRLLLALVFTASSYTCLSCSVAVVFRTFGIQLGFGYLMEVGFVSNVVTYLLNVGGVSGLPLQFLLVKKQGVATQDILAASLFQLFFSSLVLIVLLPIGLFTVTGARQITASVALGLDIAAGVLTALLVGVAVIVFVSRARSAALRLAGRVVRIVVRRDVGRQLEDFDGAMGRGLALMRRRPAVFAVLILLSIADWASTVTALWFCFDAIGSAVPVGTLIAGFSLGITAGFLSFGPGGLGVQEGSMAGIYALLGVPIGVGIVGAVLFRMVYYFIPFAVSLGFYRHLLRAAKIN